MIDAHTARREFFATNSLSGLSGEPTHGGALRFVSPDVRARLMSAIAVGFPDRATIVPFATGWTGVIFACDPEGGVVIVDPGWGDLVDTGYILEEWMRLLPDLAEQVGVDAHQRWVSASHTEIAADACVGFNVPLFLGGREADSNRSVIDMDVYWAITAQVIAQLTEGDSLAPFTIE
jgi:hypothetical protein